MVCTQVVFVYHEDQWRIIYPPPPQKKVGDYHLSTVLLVGMTATVGFPFMHRVFEGAQLRPMLKR